MYNNNFYCLANIYNLLSADLYKLYLFYENLNFVAEHMFFFIQCIELLFNLIYFMNVFENGWSNKSFLLYLINLIYTQNLI